MTRNSDVYLSSKPRYEILDGLRGVAAIIVVAFHLFETYSEGVPFQILNHGYLAVDFFFLLSGYVIGYAYDDRWNKMTTWTFLKRRFIRLHPMLVFGTLVGGALFYLGGDHPYFYHINDTPWWSVVLCLCVCILMIPAPKYLDIRGGGGLNPLNEATWSLSWEYFANVLYALVIRKLSKKALCCCVALFGVATILLCFDIDVFGVLSMRNYASYTVIGGWSLTGDQLQIGFTRLLYPFFCGLLLSRAGKRITVKNGFWWCSLFVTALLVMPRVGGSNPENYWMNGLYEAVCILILFPLIVVMGAGSNVTDKRSYAVCKFLGDISYPLYVTHYPLVYVQMSWAATHKDAPLGTHVLLAVGMFCLAIFIAYASLKVYDEPVREWLKNKCFKRKE
ncbi:MAG: acyltransferase [Prevotellaceae bacterium]|nr:acyltransferase [Prevotellaceae bacterium]